MAESTIKIVTLLPEEWQQYKAIRLEALQSDPIAFADVYDKAVTYEDSYWKNRLINPEQIWLFARDNSQIVGMIGAFIKGENRPLGTAAIVGVYVRNTYRGKGISSMLMNYLFEKLRKTGFIKKAQLWVTETQVSARKLYEKTGFTYIGKDEKPIEYNNKIYEELIMEKELL